MIKCQKNKFWLENPVNLLCSVDILPLDDMSLAEQMNCLTRLVVIIFFILIFFGFKQSLLFLLLSLLFIIILYYIQKNHMDHENFKQTTLDGRPKPSQNFHKFPTPVNLGKSQSTVLKTSRRFCNDAVPLEGSEGGAFNNPNFTSVSQKLVGGPNPKTLIPPIVAPPLADLEYWRSNNLVTHSAVNEESNIDVYNSGYQISTCCPQPIPRPQPHPQPQPQPHPQLPYIKENYSQPTQEQYLKVAPNQPGWVNTACGYNPEQLHMAGLPTNLPSGNCEQDPVFKEYNQNLFTQTIQPGVFYTNEIIEPINSNIGISFQQQFNPTTVKVNPDNGNVFFTEHDPRLFQDKPKGECESTKSLATAANVYDPRFTGYGTSYRTYNEPVTGQTRFYYDDVNAIRMPNYIVRSEIDHQPYADQYGPIQAGNEFGNRFNQDIRTLANNSFLEGTLQQRTELQERLMRKNNAIAWQQRQAPISRHTQRSMNNGLR
jgi:hypothetical protein